MRVFSRVAFIVAPLALAVSGCTDSTSPGPGGSRGPDRIATVEWEGNRPVLYLQNAGDTARVRVHFDSVSDAIPDNYGPEVSDSSILGITRMKWSPDGRYLAIIAATAFEAYQVVLVTAEGRALRTVSVNTQIIWSDVEWSPDSRRIAYVMATQMLGGLPDIFITDLTDDQIIRVTDSHLRDPGYTALRFSPDGRRLFFMEQLGWAPDSVNALSQAGYVELGTGRIVKGTKIVGDPQGISRDGQWGLFIRWSASHPDQRELFTRMFGFNRELVLGNGYLGNAVLLDDDREALVSTWNSAQEVGFRVFGLNHPGDIRLTLTTRPGTDRMALWKRPS